jgi:hypothetical protein
MARIFLLSKLIKTLVVVCKVIDVARAGIEPYVPEDTRLDWNAALDQIKAGCDVVRLVDYQDSIAGTTAPWGSR